MDIWELLRQNRSQDAIRVAKDAYTRDEKSPSDAINLAACLMWVHDWDATYEHMRHFTEVYSWTADFAFKLAGSAKWCLGDKRAAVDEWKQGIDVDYADTGGGITIPLHLYFAAVVDRSLIQMNEAIDLLQDRLLTKPHDGWPGYLAKLVLGEMAYEDALRQSIGDVNHLWGEEKRLAQESAEQEIDFWWGVRLLSEGDDSAFLAAMESYSELSWANFDTNRDVIINKLRSSVFYLARYEAEQRAWSDK